MNALYTFIAFSLGFASGGVIFWFIGFDRGYTRTNREWANLSEHERIKRMYVEFKRL